ncbi:MAG TPA: hypothetical protein VGW12_17835 [Pyrinomonadaceae bacterium]|nr:hypothetical protein [Pyrinomonadaceae bacterium]
MKFKSPTVERFMTRLSQSVLGGVFIPFFIMFLISMTDTGGSEHPLIKSRSFVYILSWPFALWEQLLPPFEAFLATVFTNFVIYSLLTYRFILWRAGLKRLP